MITPLAALAVVLAAAAAMSWPTPPIRPVPATVIQEHDAYPHPLRLAMRARAIHQRPPGRSAALGGQGEAARVAPAARSRLSALGSPGETA